MGQVGTIDMFVDIDQIICTWSDPMYAMGRKPAASARRGPTSRCTQNPAVRHDLYCEEGHTKAGKLVRLLAPPKPDEVPRQGKLFTANSTARAYPAVQHVSCSDKRRLAIDAYPI